MGSTIFSLFIVFCILWIVLRTGRRHSKLAMRRLVAQAGGIYMDGGVFSQSYVIINRGVQRLQVFIRPLSMLGGEYQMVMRAPWIDRPNIQQVTPTQYLQEGSTKQNSNSRSDLTQTISRLSNIPVKQTRFSATPQGFELFSNINNLGPTTAIHWYEISARIYDLMLADTEPGLQFVSAQQEANVLAATCQVCGTPPEPQDTVVCDRCGAPHHAECWDYNGGCAIFGCKTSAHVKR